MKFPQVPQLGAEGTASTFGWHSVGWAGIGRIAALGTAFLMSIVAARGLTAAEAGSFFAALSLASALTLLAGLGLDRAVVYLLGASRAARSAVVVTLLRRTEALAALGVAVAGVVLLVPPFRGMWEIFLHDAATDRMLYAVLLLVAGRALSRYYAESERGLGAIRRASILGDVIGPVLGLAALVVAALALGASADAGTYVLLVGAAWALAGVVGKLSRVDRTRRSREAEDSTRIGYRRIAVVSAPALVLGFGSSIIQQGDILVASTVMEPEPLAIYALASRLAVVVALPLGIAGAAIAPDIAYLYERGDTAQLSTMIRQSTVFSLLLSALIVVGLLLVGPWGLRVIAGEPFSQSWLPLVIVGLGHLGAAATGLCGLTLLMSGNERSVMMVAIVGAVSVVVATWLGAQTGSPVWVAVAVSGALIATNLLNLQVAKRKTGMNTSILGSTTVADGRP